MKHWAANAARKQRETKSNHMKTKMKKIIFHDQLGLNFEAVPPCPSLGPNQRRNRNRRLGFFGRLFRRCLAHKRTLNAKSNLEASDEPGCLVRYNPLLQ
jgi:hypothetical protein